MFLYSDESGSSQDDSDKQSANEDTDEEMEDGEWSEEIKRREDVGFQGKDGVNVDSENLQSCFDFFTVFYRRGMAAVSRTS